MPSPALPPPAPQFAPPPVRPRIRLAIGAVAVVAVVAAGAGVLAVGFAPRGESVAVGASGPVATGAPGSASAAPAVAEARPAFVHILGQVRDPGLYELREGDRVIDAVAAAGGFTSKAERAAVNLARVLVDGEQIVVPARGEAAAGASAGAGAGSPGVAGGKVNLNTADAAALETLTGVGPALAQRIVEYREANGPFRSVDDLLGVSGIGAKTLDGFRDGVTT